MDEQLKKGWETLRSIDGSAREKGVLTELNQVSPEFVDYIVKSAFGEIYSRPGLNKKVREMITIAALTVMGIENHLKDHIHAALLVGCSQEEIKEIIMQMATYGGIPRAINAMLVAKTVFEA